MADVENNTKESQSIPLLLSNTLAADILNERRNAVASQNQTANDSRNCSTAAINVLIKRTAELDAIESAATNPVLGHNAHYAAASGASMNNSQLSNAILQLGTVNQAILAKLGNS